MKIIRHFASTLVMLCPFIVFAQSDEWKEIASKDGVSILNRTADCSDPANGIFNDYLLLKVVNGNEHPVTVSFDRMAWFDGKCKGCQGNAYENRTTLEIGPNSEMEGNCASREKSLKVFSKMHDLTDVAKLTRFEVGNLTITRKITGE